MSSAIRLPIFGDPTDEQFGLRIVRAPEDRVRLYADRIADLEARVGRRAVAMDRILNASIFTDLPAVVRIAPAPHDATDHQNPMWEDPDHPCRVCGGTWFRSYIRRAYTDSIGFVRAKSRERRCVQCERSAARIRGTNRRRANAS